MGRGRLSNWTRGNKYTVNDNIGKTIMRVEGTEPPRSFSDGTGKRKYDPADPSVKVMRVQRARQYRKYGVGLPGSGALALTRQEALRAAIGHKDIHGAVHQHNAGWKYQHSAKKASKKTSVQAYNEELAIKMASVHEAQRLASVARLKSRTEKRRLNRVGSERGKVARKSFNGIRGFDKLVGQ